MAGMEISISVGSADIDLMDSLTKNARWFVKHSSGCCLPCRNNEDTSQIPFPGCRSNFRSGNGCRCTVDFELTED